MSGHRPIQGPHIPKPAGPYSPGMGFERLVFVAGQGATDPATGNMPVDIEAQTEQCLRNIDAALREAGSSFADVVRVTYVLPNGSDFEQCWPALRKYFGEVRPAAMMISAGLADPRMKIEIEVTALKRSGP